MSLDLEKLEQQLNEALEKETPETMLEFLNKQRAKINAVRLGDLLCCPDCIMPFSIKYLEGFRLQSNERWVECPNCSLGTNEKYWKKKRAI